MREPRAASGYPNSPVTVTVPGWLRVFSSATREREESVGNWGSWMSATCPSR